ncbi:MAG TPA: M23 family metallopeptidase [Streptosporangiaceae bacterium]|jgi:hypothetical protein
MRERFPYYVARVRAPLMWAFVALAVAARLFHLAWLWPLSLALLIAGLACYFKVGTVRRAAVVVAPPVAGRWVAVNSPADRVPSHGVHAYGQTYAIDLVHHPDDDRAWQGVHRWPPARRPETFPAFGQPVYAVADGVVVKATDWQRDHWSRNSVPGLLYLFAEGNLRELFGPRFILGNHVVIDLGDGVYAAYAHLRRGSIRVTEGQRVIAGQQIAGCGNSGNSSEPHVHFQLMDRRGVLFAAGLPFAFDRLEVDGDVRDGVPGGRRPFRTSPAREHSTVP